MKLDKIYYSGSVRDRARILHCAQWVYRNLGIESTSNWLMEPAVTVEAGRDDWIPRARANEDRLDLQRADAVVVFTDVPSTEGGFHSELGMALALNKPIFAVGLPETRKNVFLFPTQVKWYDTWDAFLMEEFNA